MFGKKLKQIRKHLSLTQDNMAELIGISFRTYASYERDENKPPYSMLVYLCSKHNINLNWLIADIGDMLITNEQQFENEKDIFTKRVKDILKEEGLI